MNDFLNNFIEIVTKKYALFEGRARRNEFWSFVLVYILGSIATSIIDSIISSIIGFSLLSLLYSLALLVPYIAVGIRRMHDTGHSGWFLLIPLYNLYLAIQPGNAGQNEYGPDPKGTVGVTA